MAARKRSVRQRFNAATTIAPPLDNALAAFEPATTPLNFLQDRGRHVTLTTVVMCSGLALVL